MVYMRGGIDIKAIITGDADFGTGSTTAVTAFVAGAPLRVVMSLNAFVDQALYAQTEVSEPGAAQGPVHRLAQSRRFGRHAVETESSSKKASRRNVTLSCSTWAARRNGTPR